MAHRRRVAAVSEKRFRAVLSHESSIGFEKKRNKTKPREIHQRRKRSNGYYGSVRRNERNLNAEWKFTRVSQE